MYLPSRRSLLRGASAAAMACSLPRPGFAQTGYPTRPVTLVVAYPAGGQNDLTARVVTQPFSGYWGQPVAVDRVIGGFLMGGQRNAFGEPGRDGAAMRGDAADLAHGQPQAAGHHQSDSGKKEEGEVGAHETGCEAMRKWRSSRSRAII